MSKKLKFCPLKNKILHNCLKNKIGLTNCIVDTILIEKI